jgi:succinyl-diaminopimelate desuccinylase
MMDVISLTRKLLSFNTVNPPGNEAEIAVFTGGFLQDHGFRVRYFEFGPDRLHMIAEKGLSVKKPAIVLSRHFDTVPLGKKEWSTDPFGGDINDGRIGGRGSTDMKGGLSAMMIASVDSFSSSAPEGGVRLIFTAGEELGCQGISALAAENHIAGEASAVIVGEPTGNIPANGHKGAIYLNASASGKTAHSSMPEMGDNAIYKAATAILKLKNLSFDAEKDDFLGFPTINVGKVSGGMNINSVPDHAEFTIDVRTTAKLSHERIMEILEATLGHEIILEKLVDLHPVFTTAGHPFMKVVYEVCGIADTAKALPYLTDGAVLQKVYGCPVVILGPGEPEQAHQTDEFCYIDKLERSVDIYRNIILNWSGKDD